MTSQPNHTADALRLITTRREQHRAARDYMDNPTPANLAALKRLTRELDQLKRKARTP